MKTLSVSKLMVMTLVMPLLQACGKAKYEQVQGRGDMSPGFIQQQNPRVDPPRTFPPMPSGSQSVPSRPRHLPPPEPFEPEADHSGEQGEVAPPPPPPTIKKTIESNQPAPVRGNAQPDDWMDPTRYPRAAGNTAPDVPRRPCITCPGPVAVKPVVPVYREAIPAPPVYRPTMPAPVQVPAVIPPIVRQAPVVAPLPVPVLRQPTTPLQCKSESFQQTAAAATSKMDILFVVDTSESVLREREAAAANIDRLIQQLPEGVDYNVAVMLAHSSVTGRDGELFISPNRESAVLKSKEMSRDQIRAGLQAKLTQFPGDRNSDGGELGLYSLMKALEDTRRGGGDKGTRDLNLGMFRADAAQTIIFLADENDLCTRTTPTGAKVAADPNHAEIPAAKRFCKGVTPQSVYNLLMTRRGPGATTYQGGSKQTVVYPVLVAAMVYTNPATVPTQAAERWASENEVGYGYLDMVRLNGGVAIDLANIDMGEALSRIGQAAYGKLIKEVTHQIPQGQVDFNTVCTLVDDKEVPYAWDNTAKRLTARGLARPGSRVEFHYCMDNGVRAGDRYDTIQIDQRCRVLRQRFNR